MLGHFSMLFRIFVPFWTHLAPSCDFFDFFMIFLDFSLIWDGFWEDFWMVFRGLLAFLVKIVIL